MSSSSNGDAAPSPPHARDVLLHLEAYLARRDGVDKLLKISRYAAKLALTSPSVALTPFGPRLRSFESSVGLSRKAFRLGKFLQDLNSLRSLPSPISPLLLSLSLLAYAGEGTYYFLEQFVWLAKSGLIPKHHLSRLQYLSACADLIGYCGSFAIKLREEASLRSKIEEAKDAGERAKLQEKLTMKRLSIVQDLADVLMALADVRDGKGLLTGPRLMASAGLASALISAHKNWRSC